MASSQRFFEGIVDRTPYTAWVYVAVIVGATLGLGMYGIVKIGAYSNEHFTWLHSYQAPNTSAAASAAAQAASNAANSAVDQAKSQGQSLIDQARSQAQAAAASAAASAAGDAVQSASQSATDTLLKQVPSAK